MKTKIFILFILLLSVTSETYAQRAVSSGSIQIASERPETLQVEVSGLLSFRENVRGSVLLSNLMPGEYRVRISATQGGRRGGTNILEQPVRIQSGQRTVINISANNRTSITSAPDPNSVRLCIDGGNTGNHRPTTPSVRPISDADLSKLVAELNQQSFDRGKLSLLDVSATYHYYLSEQLRRVLATFNNDASKLECARLLIPHVLDPENLYLLGSVFTFSRNRESFLNLIRESR
jgi:hypothetical protein